MKSIQNFRNTARITSIPATPLTAENTSPQLNTQLSTQHSAEITSGPVHGGLETFMYGDRRSLIPSSMYINTAAPPKGISGGQAQAAQSKQA